MTQGGSKVEGSTQVSEGHLSERRLSGTGLVATMCIGQVLVQIGASVWPALLPDMMLLWGLTNSEEGWITAIFLGAYMLAVPVLVPLTDRIDPRHIYLLGVGLTCFGSSAFRVVRGGLLDRALRTSAHRHRMGWHLHDRIEALGRQG